VALDPDLELFARARFPALLRFGLLLAGNRHDAEDLVQTALMRTALRWRSVQEPEPYVRQAMVRLHLNWRTRFRARMAAEPVPDLAAPAVDTDTRLVLWQALARLPARQRTVLVLRYYEDLSEAEIAAALGVSRGTVKSTAARALAKLREQTGLREGPAAAGHTAPGRPDPRADSVPGTAGPAPGAPQAAEMPALDGER
jgi:RNA polymerase sigma-70 factor (sigma-E family)